jgi:hypothetical protein
MNYSIMASVIERVENFTWSQILPDEVKIFAFEAPVTDVQDDPVQPPFVIIIDDGIRYSSTFESEAKEIQNVRFEIYGTSLYQVDRILEIIRFNGGGVTEGRGMDRAEFDNLPERYLNQKCVPVATQRFQERVRLPNANLCFRCRQVYTIEVQRI